MIQVIIPLLEILIEDKNHEILKNACAACLSIAENLIVEDRASHILTLILRILHDEEEETKLKALGALKSLIPLLNPDVCECFVMKEALILAAENIVKVRKAVAECIPKLCKGIKTEESVQKLLFTFRDLVKDNIWGVRKACADTINDLFDGFNNTSQDLFVLALFLDLLKDKSNNVKQCIWVQLGPCIHKCKVTVPEEMIEAYVELSKNISNKGEFQVHFSFYLPAVLDKLGKLRWETLKPGILSIVQESEIKAKKSLLAGFHEIGKILGPDLATEELCPIYENIFSENSVTKQLAVNCLSKFLRTIRSDRRNNFIKYLKVLHKFTAVWRIRLSVAEQLVELMDLFEFALVLAEFYPIVMNLVADKVWKIRYCAALALGKLVSLVVRAGDSHQILLEFRNMASGNWNEKLVFITACQELAEMSNFEELYGEEFMALCEDKAVNIRIACAKVLKKVNSDYEDFWSQVKKKLVHDFDADVRYEVLGNYDMDRGVVKLRPNAEKHIILMSPMFRALFKDEDVDEVINFRPEAYQLLGYLKAAVTPDATGFVERLSFDVAQKAKMLIEF